MLAGPILRSVSTLSVARPSVPVLTPPPSGPGAACFRLTRHTTCRPPVRHLRSAMWVRDRTRDGSNCVYVNVCAPLHHLQIPPPHIRGSLQHSVGGRRVQIKLTHYDLCVWGPHVIVGPSRDQLICAIPTPVSQEAAPAGEALTYVALLAFSFLAGRLSGVEP